jgi:hypothetical protein
MLPPWCADVMHSQTSRLSLPLNSSGEQPPDTTPQSKIVPHTVPQLAVVSDFVKDWTPVVMIDD